MPINPNIIGQLNDKPLNFGNPIQDYTQGMNLRHLMLQGDAQEKKLNEDERASNVLRQAGGDLTKAMPLMINEGLFSHAQAIAKSIDEAKLHAATINSQNARALNETAGAAQKNAELKANDIFNAVRRYANTDDPNVAISQIPQALENPNISPEAKAHLQNVVLPAYQSTVDAFNKGDARPFAKANQQLILDVIPKPIDYVNATKPKLGTVDTADKINFYSQDRNGIPTITGSLSKGTSPTSTASESIKPIAVLDRDAQGNDIPGKVVLVSHAEALRNRMTPVSTDAGVQGNLAGAKVGAKIATNAAADLPKIIDNANNGIANIDKMIGDAQVIDGKIVIPKGGKAPHPGFESSVGANIQPGFQYIPGTKKADFYALKDQVLGGAFLQAFETLKGGGSITNIEGDKGTAAITRMKTAQSEPEFIDAARDLQRIMRQGLKRAEGRAQFGSTGNVSQAPATTAKTKAGATVSNWSSE